MVKFMGLFMKRIKGEIVIAENEKFTVKVYEKDGGIQHVHFVRKIDGADLKLSLETLLPLRATRFDRQSVKTCMLWLNENLSYVKRKWRSMRRKIYGKEKK